MASSTERDDSAATPAPPTSGDTAPGSTSATPDAAQPGESAGRGQGASAASPGVAEPKPARGSSSSVSRPTTRGATSVSSSPR
ncbi:hypothetical protein AB6N24_07390, partial [Cellulomonas sp. 179-A 4D5 NHS]|uniref:hypothetical protein n=1 Tax=Cellulomonas sp. 179-A 4D5 NHS TaxID=3142378 RepID=UPI0039A01736